MATASPPTPDAKPTLHPDFVPKMVRTYNDPQEHGVHLLFNEWWEHAPEATIDRYLANFRALPGAKSFLEARFIADPLSLEDLEARPAGSLGRGYFVFLTDNGLEKNLATDYKLLHDFMSAKGRLDRMPDDLKYAIIRGFQVHDILHVVTGYSSSPLHELELQAFCLAQLQFPYFGMWMATTTSRMTFLEPDGIVPVMNAISRGWQRGRATPTLQLERWEARFDEPLDAVRAAFDLAPEGLGA